jgi:hypothetical protein
MSANEPPVRLRLDANLSTATSSVEPLCLVPVNLIFCSAPVNMPSDVHHGINGTHDEEAW